MYEISQKQKYIFRTNRLIENIGASSIICNLTEKPHYFLNNLFKYKIVSSESEKVELPSAEFSIVGGGNATYIFQNQHDAEQFSQKLSASILRYFPGIELFLVMRDIDWENNLYPQKGENSEGVLSEMRTALADKKNRRTHSVQQLSWGIHQVCKESGLPANMKWSDRDSMKKVGRAKELIVKETVGKVTRNIDFKNELILQNDELPKPDQLNFLTEKIITNVFGNDEKGNNTKSYLAIVHIDGNAMGTKVAKFLEQPFKSNVNYLEEYKKFTDKIDQSYKTAFKKTISHLMKDYGIWAENLYGSLLKNPELLNQLKNTVPIRPIIASGDDICFITFGQLGIETARIFIQYLQQQSMDINEKKVFFEAAAGVAIIRHKFPFWLGYELAEKLCSNAKKRLKNDQKYWEMYNIGTKEAPFDTSLIDWQLIEGGDSNLDIESVRSISYINKDGSMLIQRPLYLQKHDGTIRHFANYEESFLHGIHLINKSFQEKELNHTEKKLTNNGVHLQAKDCAFPSFAKWKQLRDVYHQGQTAVELWQNQAQFQIGGNKLFISYPDGFGFINRLQEKHHSPNQTVFASYYDAVEIFDHFIPLSEVKSSEPNDCND